MTTAISWWRRRSSHERPLDRLPEVGRDDMADDVARHDWIWAELQALPIKQRSAIVLRFYEDLSVADTAYALGCSEGSVKSQVSRGLARLKQTLGDIEELPEMKENRS